MTQNAGTLVIAPVRPNDSADTYPSAYANELYGGFHTAADATERLAIPTSRLADGTWCWQQSDKTAWYWDQSLSGGAGAWVAVTLGGGAATAINLSTATITGTLPTANTPSLTGDLTKSAGSSVTSITANSVTNAKLAQMAAATIKGRAVGSGTGDPVDLSPVQATAILNEMVGDTGSGGTKGLVRAPAAGDAARRARLMADDSWQPIGPADIPVLGVQRSSVTIPSGTFGSSVDAVYLSANGCWYLPAKTAGKVFKINATSGVITTLTPPEAPGARSGIIYSVALGKMIVGGLSTGFSLLDPTNDTFGSLVTPSGWQGLNASYDETNDLVYYPRTVSLGRCTSTGGSVANSTAFTSNAGRVLVVGTDAYVLELASGASKLHKYTTASWPNEVGTALNLGVTLSFDTGLAYDSVSGKILIGGLNGNMFVVDPSTMTLSTTITLSGGSAVATNYILVDAISQRIYAQDSGAKCFVLDASTYAFINNFIPSTVAAASGMVYNPDLRQLGFLTNASTLLQLFV